ncbi:hypothetical protein EV702DRAFT_1051520 [Suillus placidus]|uniref:Uncharacterized protein n=1 Tax=Suillus placidus TaxID=48579 RepID=A0A9P6ZFL1_9AGAM|nr:hypothetical protein EV702DRAFT_1051520 [Suillus placidus]
MIRQAEKIILLCNLFHPSSQASSLLLKPHQPESLLNTPNQSILMDQQFVRSARLELNKGWVGNELHGPGWEAALEQKHQFADKTQLLHPFRIRIAGAVGGLLMGAVVWDGKGFTCVNLGFVGNELGLVGGRGDIGEDGDTTPELLLSPAQSYSTVSIKLNVILLLNTFLCILIFYGEAVAQWSQAGYQDQDGYKNFKELLEKSRVMHTIEELHGNNMESENQKHWLSMRLYTGAC